MWYRILQCSSRAGGSWESVSVSRTIFYPLSSYIYNLYVSRFSYSVLERGGKNIKVQ